MLVYNDLNETERVRLYDKGVTSKPLALSEAAPSAMSYRVGDTCSPYIEFHEPLAYQDQHFVNCVLNGTRPATDGEAGRAVVAVLEAAQVSLREHRRATIDDETVATPRGAVADPQFVSGSMQRSVPFLDLGAMTQEVADVRRRGLAADHTDLFVHRRRTRRPIRTGVGGILRDASGSRRRERDRRDRAHTASTRHRSRRRGHRADQHLRRDGGSGRARGRNAALRRRRTRLAPRDR